MPGYGGGPNCCLGSHVKSMHGDTAQPSESQPSGAETAVPQPIEAAQTPGPLFENPGYCACCRNQTVFTAHDAWLRDFYLCRNCGSIPRQRHLQTVLDETVSGWHDLTVHESSPSNDFIAKWCSDYASSQYFADVPRGEYRDGVRSENVEALTFPDESIDLFITQDVLEHVFDPERAVQEIHRVLRPGGAHVFTAPKHRGLDRSRRRARLTADGTVEHLLPEEYHGNPIGDNKALVTWDYGYDFEQLLSRWSGVGVQAHHRLDRSRGLDAEFNEVFVIRKPSLTAGRPPAARPDAAQAPSIRASLGQIRRGVTGWPARWPVSCLAAADPAAVQRPGRSRATMRRTNSRAPPSRHAARTRSTTAPPVVPVPSPSCRRPMRSSTRSGDRAGAAQNSASGMHDAVPRELAAERRRRRAGTGPPLGVPCGAADSLGQPVDVPCRNGHAGVRAGRCARPGRRRRC